MKGLTIIDPLKHIRANPEMYLPYGHLVPDDLAAMLASEALDVTREEVRVARKGVWWLVSCSADWLPRKWRREPMDFFHRVIHEPRFGPHSMYREVVVTANANAVVTAVPDAHWVIKGEVGDKDALWRHLAALRDWQRVVAFRMNSKAGKQVQPS